MAKHQLKFAIDADRPLPRRPFGLMAKPTGSRCNLDCSYCYYLEKERLYPDASTWVMPDAVLEAYVRGLIEATDGLQVEFVWQGGEPTLAGVDFYRKAVSLQRRYAGTKRVSNSLQTNGTLLDDEWAAFLRENRFLIGLSLDGPEDLHDANRIDKRGRPTYTQVMKAWELLTKYGVDTNVLSTVNRATGAEPHRVYGFLKGIGAKFLQFIPVVERLRPDGRLAAPTDDGRLAPWSVGAEQYGEFLVAIYDEWITRDVGEVFVQLFDVCLNVWLGRESPLCVFRRTCGDALVLEHNGDVYSCDHFVYPQYRRGNLRNVPLSQIARNPDQRAFGKLKESLPAYCQRCDVRFACNGECPKHRFVLTPDGESGLNYLCPSYKRFFTHVDPTMKRMAQLVRTGRPAADVMKALEGLQ